LQGCPKPGYRDDGARAVQLAMQASEATGGNNPIILNTLAAAYAEAGRYPDAISTAQAALKLAEGQKDSALVEGLRQKISLYEAGRPFHEAH
jgi:protein O-mannosyl-transferase